MRVLLTGASLIPSYGGPAYSVSRLASALTDCGLKVGLWAADQSAPTTPMLPAGSPVIRLGGTEVEALERFGRVDILHDNGLWLRHNHRLARLAEQRRIARIVSPRGMLEPWAMNQKRWKKSLAWKIYQRRDLANVACLHTTADQETNSVQSLGFDVPVCMVPNGVDLPNMDRTAHVRREEASERKTALFLGRLHPKKGLLMLIEAWAKLRPEGWVLRIAGPDEAGHRIRLEEAVTANRLGETISFVGPVDCVQKRNVFLDADLFVLPTYSENFGIVVAEALAHGVPVLTTTGAPWPLLPKAGCGWWVRPTVDGIVDGLAEATSCSRETLGHRGAKGREVVATRFAWTQIANDISSMYDTALTGRAFAR